MPLADKVGADFRTVSLSAASGGPEANGKSTKTVIEMRCFANNRDFQFSGECIDWISGQLVRQQGNHTGTPHHFFCLCTTVPGIRTEDEDFCFQFFHIFVFIGYHLYDNLINYL